MQKQKSFSYICIRFKINYLQTFKSYPIMGQITITGATVEEVINLAMSMKNSSVAVAAKSPSVPEASAPKAAPSAGVPRTAPSTVPSAPKAAPSAGVPRTAPSAVPSAPKAPPTRTAPPKKKGLDIEDVRVNQNNVTAQTGGKAFVKETLNAFGVSKLSELGEDLLEEYNDALLTFGEEEENYD